MKKTILILLFIALGFNTFLWGQQLYGDQANQQFSGSDFIAYSTISKSVSKISFSDQSDYSKRDLEKINRFLLGENPKISMKLLRSESDQYGMTHDRYQQYYNNIPLEGKIFIYHYQNGRLVTANGDIDSKITLNTTPKISEETALKNAIEKSKLISKEGSIQQKSTELLITSSKDQYHLAYKCIISTNKPHHTHAWIYIDAITGKFIKEINQVCTINVTGTAHTHFSGVQQITTDSVSPSNFLLQQTSSGGGITTYNSDTYDVYSDTDNDWNNVNTNQDEFATDVHFGLESTYDYYFSNFSHNSYDGNGSPIIGYVNDASTGVNAYWSGSYMVFGNGDADYFPVASLEVAGHELTHGVTQFTAGLEYADESGALNESFSDIFGATIRFLYAPSVASWYVGDQIPRPGSGGEPFRNMANPNEFQNADTYGGLYFNNGDVVHYDSGIQNFWYYLLVEGGTGTNDNGDNYAVTAIGMTDAMKIAFRNLKYYLTPSSTFQDARTGAEQAAIDLFGLCSPQHLEVVHAWYAVGVGSNTPEGQPVADFDVSNSFSCTAPLTASFSSNSGYENYLWNFGDGTTSTLQNPTHNYTTNGNYDVTLTVSNTSVCIGNDQNTITSAVVVNAMLPVATFTSSQLASAGVPMEFFSTDSLGVNQWFWDFGDGSTSTLQNPVHTFSNTGVYSITLIVHNCAGSDTIVFPVTIEEGVNMCGAQLYTATSGIVYDSGGDSDNYQDNENCQILIQPCNAQTVTFHMEDVNIEYNWDYLYVYDGATTSDPQIAVYTGSDSQGTYTSTGNSILVVFTSDVYVNEGGFKMIYSSTPNPSVQTTALFSASTYTPTTGEVVSFQDQSLTNPIGWYWNFGDGTISTLQNPTHTYNSLGTYTVTLITTFCNGSDTSEAEVSINSVGLNSLGSSYSNQISIFPNPSSGQFKIASTTNIYDVVGSVIDLSGRIIQQLNYSFIDKNGVSISTDINSGSYFLELNYYDENNNFIHERKQIVINH